MAGEIDQILQEELSHALSCEERALFFAPGAIDEVAKKAAQNTSRQSENEYPDEGEIAEAVSQGDQPTTSTGEDSIPDEEVDPRIDQIADAYGFAFGLIGVTLKQITDRYRTLVTILWYARIFGIVIPDRNVDALSVATKIVGERFKALIDPLLEAEPPKISEAENWIDSYKSDWKGLRNICNLFMEEIGYLTSRIESLQNTLSVIIGWGLSISAIVVSIHVANLGISAAHQDALVAHKDAMAALPKADEETPVHAIHKEFDNLNSDQGHLKAIEKHLTAIGDILTAISMDIHDPKDAENKKDIFGALVNINQTLAELKESINDNASSKGDIFVKLDTISEAVKHLDTSIHNIPGPPQDIPSITSNIEKLEESVEELRLTIEKKQIPEIKQENKAIINFEK